VILDNPVAAAHLYRIAQEATSNAVRHGRAKHIGIELARHSERVLLSIEDDGSGLSEEAEQGRQDGLGLRIMAHRARIIGATFDVRRGAARGTLVRCSLTQPIQDSST
jgi:signal transduction histidine kinase